ncbi:hypothetical protein BaRGS_00038456 [Batillaria attramentaria]|uniref:BTB domain-containing protein n=1 Tax=Batillaria attramentaria TaxID=370345 RepID=A0ABD0J5P1_9CAEN
MSDFRVEHVLNKAFRQGIQLIYSDKELFDLTVVVSGKEFQCHRLILVAVSDFFRLMLTHPWQESASRVVHIDHEDVTEESFQLILNILYLRENITIYTAMAVLKTAIFLQISFLQKPCMIVLGNETLSHECISVWQFARKYDLEVLEEQMMVQAAETFLDVPLAESQDFLSLSKELLLILLTEHIQRVKIHTVADLFHAVFQWMLYNVDERKEHLGELLQTITFLGVKCRDVRKFLPYTSTDLSDILGDDWWGRESHIMVAVNWNIYIMGGQHKAFPALDTLVYDVRTRNWTNRGQLLGIMSDTTDIAAASLGHRIYIFCGKKKGGGDDLNSNSPATGRVENENILKPDDGISTLTAVDTQLSEQHTDDDCSGRETETASNQGSSHNCRITRHSEVQLPGACSTSPDPLNSPQRQPALCGRSDNGGFPLSTVTFKCMDSGNRNDRIPYGGGFFRHGEELLVLEAFSMKTGKYRRGQQTLFHRRAQFGLQILTIPNEFLRHQEDLTEATGRFSFRLDHFAFDNDRRYMVEPELDSLPLTVQKMKCKEHYKLLLGEDFGGEEKGIKFEDEPLNSEPV